MFGAPDRSAHPIPGVRLLRRPAKAVQKRSRRFCDSVHPCTSPCRASLRSVPNGQRHVCRGARCDRGALHAALLALGALSHAAGAGDGLSPRPRHRWPRWFRDRSTRAGATPRRGRWRSGWPRPSSGWPRPRRGRRSIASRRSGSASIVSSRWSTKAAWASSSPSRWKDRPRCQSEVCRILTPPTLRPGADRTSAHTPMRSGTE